MMADYEMEQHLRKIRTRFVESLIVNYPKVKQLDINIKSGTVTAEMILEVHVITHKIAGVAATLGMRILGEKAIGLDAMLGEIVDSDEPPSDIQKLSAPLADIMVEMRVASDI